VRLKAINIYCITRGNKLIFHLFFLSFRCGSSSLSVRNLNAFCDLNFLRSKFNLLFISQRLTLWCASDASRSHFRHSKLPSNLKWENYSSNPIGSEGRYNDADGWNLA
jgi:hypothetical protein